MGKLIHKWGGTMNHHHGQNCNDAKDIQMMISCSGVFQDISPTF